MILSNFQDNTEAKAKMMQKSVRKLFCNYSESSFRERLGSIKGNIHLMEFIYVVSAQTLEICEIDRKYFNLVSKSSRGDIIAPLAWQPWNKAWQLQTATKRQMYGSANRIEVAGPAPKGIPVFENGPGDTEPATFHQIPNNMYKLLLEEHPLHGVIDRCPGQGLLALECIAKRTSGVNKLRLCFEPYVHHALVPNTLCNTRYS